MNKERHLIVISGPSGSGKDTVVKRLMELHPEIEVSVSATTRPMRSGEKEGVNYFYLTREEFERRIQAGEILEYAEYCEKIGAGNIKKIYPNAVTIFVRPPSYGELEERLRGRGTETEESIKKRLARAVEEMEYAVDYNEVVVNDTVDECAEEIYNLIQKYQQEEE